MTLADLLDRAAMLSAPLDTTGLPAVRARLFGRLRASGWAPAGAPRGGRAPSADHSDEALLAALVAGDPAAFDVLFDRHAPRLNGQARRWLQPTDADDAVQEAFLVLFTKAEHVLAHQPVNVGGFLFGTLRHKAQHLLAAHLRNGGAPNEALTSPDEDGLDALLRREDEERLAKLLDRVCNPLEQAVVSMRLQDRDFSEIAQALGITPGHARVLWHRALKKLGPALDDEDGR